MLDLSVSWNTSQPVFKKLPDGPEAFLSPCTISPNGENLFMLARSVGYSYNVKSASWTTVKNDKFPVGVGLTTATDPESGLVYIINGPTNTTKGEVLELHQDTKTLNTTTMAAAVSPLATGAWCAPLRSMLVISTLSNKTINSFTPSKLKESSHGWSTMNTTGSVPLDSFAPCFVPAYNGTKMVFFAGDAKDSAVYILDVATKTWKKGVNGPGAFASACAVTGDQFIAWGGGISDDSISNKTLVYDMKTDTWNLSYIAPPSSQPTMTTISQTPIQPVPPTTATPEAANAISSNKKRTVNIAVSVGFLVVMIMTGISVYFGSKKRGNADVKSTGSNESLAGDPLDADRESIKGSIRSRETLA